MVITLSACVSEPRDPSFGRPGSFDPVEAAKTRVSLGLTYLQNGNFTQAKFNLDRALEFAPRDGQAHFAMAFYYQQVGEVARAEESYEKALDFSNNDPDVLNSYGAFLCQLGQYDKAKDYFLRAVNDRNYVSSAETYENLAICSTSQGKREEAIAFFNSALNHQPTRSDSLFLLTQLYVEDANWEEAKKTLFKYERTSPISAETLYFQYQIAQGMNDTKTAVGYGEILKSMYPDHPNTKAYLTSMGKFKPAANVTRKTRQVSPPVQTLAEQPVENVAKNSITLIDTTPNTVEPSNPELPVAAPTAVVATNSTASANAADIAETTSDATLAAAAEATAALVSQATQGAEELEQTSQDNEQAQTSVDIAKTEVADDVTPALAPDASAEIEELANQNMTKMDDDVSMVVEASDDAIEATESEILAQTDELTDEVQTIADDVVTVEQENTQVAEAGSQVIAQTDVLDDAAPQEAVDTFTPSESETLAVVDELPDAYASDNTIERSVTEVTDATSETIEDTSALVDDAAQELTDTLMQAPETEMLAEINEGAEQSASEIASSATILEDEASEVAAEVTEDAESLVDAVESEVIEATAQTEVLVEASVSDAADDMAALEQQTDDALANALNSNPVQAIENDEEGDVDAQLSQALASLESAVDSTTVASSDSDEMPSEVAEEITEDTSTNEDGFHVVLPKENLYRISLKYNVKMNSLLEWNNLTDASDIKKGSRLRVKAPDNNDK
jgi:type IV pilus assembly protein PilF